MKSNIASQSNIWKTQKIKLVLPSRGIPKKNFIKHHKKTSFEFWRFRVFSASICCVDLVTGHASLDKWLLTWHWDGNVHGNIESFLHRYAIRPGNRVSPLTWVAFTCEKKQKPPKNHHPIRTRLSSQKKSL